jgi:glycerophosphoryl diester phosphodiesterase
MSSAWLRIAHRGASGSAPEHTRAAFEQALRLSVDMIELDVQLSRDEALIVIHDATLDRTTNGHGIVREHAWQDLKALDAGSWFEPGFAGERLLRLEDVIKLVGDRARLNVEMKGCAADWRILAKHLIQVLRTAGRLQATIVSCFEPLALEKVRAASPDVQLGLLWQSPELAEAWQWGRALLAVSIHPYWALVSADLVRDARDRRLQVFAWTVNEVEIMRQLIREGVDGIISDTPERFAEAGGEMTHATA